MTQRDFGTFNRAINPGADLVTTQDGSVRIGGIDLAAYAKDSSGNVTGLVGPDGYPINSARVSPWPQSGVSLFSPGDGQTLTVTTGANATLNSQSTVTVDGEAWRTYSVTATSSSGNYIEVNIPTFGEVSADTARLIWGVDATVSGAAATVYLGTTAYATFAASGTTLSAASESDIYGHSGAINSVFCAADWSKTGFSRDSIEQFWTVAKIRLVVPNGSTIVFRLRSLNVAFRRRIGRIAIVADDGYASFFRSGVPILQRYGLVSTAAIIADKVGTSALYTTEAELRQYVDDGNMCVAHGPTGGTGNIFSTFATDAAAVADMALHRDWLINRRLTNTKGAQCYIWPQGVWSRTAGDASFLDLAWDAGFRCGRVATVKTTKYGLAPLQRGGKQNLIMHIIGHSYAGAANTADDATETTNITNILARITAVAEAGLDCVLMLHKTVARGAASETIAMEADRLQTLADGIRDLVVAGSLESITMDQMVP